MHTFSADSLDSPAAERSAGELLLALGYSCWRHGQASAAAGLLDVLALLGPMPDQALALHAAVALDCGDVERCQARLDELSQRQSRAAYLPLLRSRAMRALGDHAAASTALRDFIARRAPVRRAGEPGTEN